MQIREFDLGLLCLLKSLGTLSRTLILVLTLNINQAHRVPVLYSLNKCQENQSLNNLITGCIYS